MAERSMTLIDAREVVRLYDAQDKEIGMTVGGSNEIAYAMACSRRIEKAVAYSKMFGREITVRADMVKYFEKVKNKHYLGDNLLFWVGDPLIVNK